MAYWNICCVVLAEIMSVGEYDYSQMEELNIVKREDLFE
jgi:hypothetical protein